MKILHVFYTFTTGGAEVMLVDIMNEQVKHENVSIFIINDIFDPELLAKISPQVTIRKLNKKKGSKNPFKYLLFNLHLVLLNPDIIHFHCYTGHKIVFPFFKYKKIYTIHSTNLPIYKVEKYHKLLSISKAVQQDTYERFHLNSDIIYNGIHTQLIKPKVVNEPLGQFNIVMVGRLDHEIKGQHIAIQAIKQLIDKGFKNIHLDIIGEGVSKEYLLKLTHELQLEQYVSFLGLKDRNYIYNHLCNYLLLLQPSIIEGFGLTIIEGMAAKIPVLTSNIEGPMEVIRNGQIGYFFKEKDVMDCADKIEYIINHPDEVKNKIEAAYSFINQNFEITKTARQYIEKYREIIY